MITSKIPLRCQVFAQLSQHRFNSCIKHHQFSTSPVSFAYQKFKRVKQLASTPDYPHGPARWFKRSNKGLFGGAKVQFGNKVSKGKWITKTRRKWLPNVRNATLYSEALHKSLKLKVTARVLRTIDKEGGIDKYLLKTKSARVKELGVKGWELRWKVMQTPKVREEFRKQQKDLGMSKEAIKAAEAERAELLADFKTKAVETKTQENEARKLQQRRRQDIWDGKLIEDLQKIALREAYELTSSQVNIAKPKVQDQIRERVQQRIMLAGKTTTPSLDIVV